MRTARSFAVLAGALLASLASAQVDLTVSDFPGAIAHWTGSAAIEGKRAYSFGLLTCNFGNAPASWNGSTPEHPVFTQNLYRVSAAGIEQIGMGFAFHGFFPLQGAACLMCNPATGMFLGEGCSTPDTASILGSQPTLGPRSAINASTGAVDFPIPPTSCSGAICERIQASEADLAVPLAVYIGETILVHAEDALAGNAGNNASYRRLAISPAFVATYTGPTVEEEPAVHAWRNFGGALGAEDPRVKLWHVDVPGDGRFAMGARALQVSGTDWRYAYAIENVNSDRSAGGFSVPHPGAIVSGVTFRDINYHSGEAYDPTDWSGAASATSVSWATPHTFAEDPNSSAVRWGTMANFGFVASAHPVWGRATITLFKPGAPGAGAVASVNVFTVIPGPPPCPGDATGDDAVNFADLNSVLATFGGSGAPVLGDVTADGQVTFADLNAVLANFGSGC